MNFLYVMVIDALLIAVPFLGNEVLINIIGWTIGIAIVVFIVLQATNEEEVKETIREQFKPYHLTTTYIIYDIATDLAFMAAWYYIGWYELVGLLLINNMFAYKLKNDIRSEFANEAQ